VALAVVLCASAGVEVHPQNLAPLDSIVPALMRRHDVPGLALTIVRGDRVLALRGWGLARVVDSARVDPDSTIFRVASVAKLFVATVVVQLADQGALDLRRDLDAYLDDWRVPARDGPALTLHHLLTQTGGFDERLVGYASPSRDSMPSLGGYLGRNLPHRGWRAGVVTGYSNHGLALAAYVAGRAAGRPFDRLAAERLFEPLAMTSTRYLEVPGADHRMARGHFCDETRCVEAPEVYSNPYPAGFAYSTARDMSRFLLALLDSADTPALSSSARESLLRQQFTHDSLLPGISYVFFNQGFRGHRVLAHAGTVPGTNNLLVLVPDAGLGFYFVANGGRSRFGEALRDELFSLLLPDRPNGETSGAPTMTLPREYVHALAGPYQMTRYAHRTIEKFPTLFGTGVALSVDSAGRLVLPYPNGARAFEPIDSLHFREVGGERLIAFRRDDRGRITHLFAPIPVFGSELPAAFERLAWHDAPYFMNEYTSWLLLGGWILLLGVWPLIATISWLRRRRAGTPAPARGPRAVLVALLLFNALWTTFGFLFVARSVRMLSQATGLVYGVSADMRLLALIPYALAIVTVTIIVAAVQAWRRRDWDFGRRAALSLLAVNAVLVVAFLVRWNYLPARF
jgi:CubicO group peptidase (beta-lactamase class C family)